MENKAIIFEESVDIGHLVQYVQYLKFQYRKIYGTEPKYIKMPQTLCHAIHRYYRHYLCFERVGFADAFCGLIICETVSILSVDEIEVF